MSIPVPIKVPHEDKAQRRPPLLPPDDPNADRMERAPDIDPPPTDPPFEEPEKIEPPARAYASAFC